MFETIDYLQSGNERQQLAFTAIKNLRILENLIEYDPILCGTLPLGIDVEGSDLDIIMEVHQFVPFAEKVVALYGKGELPVEKTCNSGYASNKSELYFQRV